MLVLNSALCPQGARCPRRASCCTAPSPASPSASARPFPRRSCCAWRGPSRRTTTWWAPSASSWPAASASPRHRYRRPPVPRPSRGVPRCPGIPSPGSSSAPAARSSARPARRSCCEIPAGIAQEPPSTGRPRGCFWAPRGGFGIFCVAAFGCYSRRGRFGAGNAALASSRAPERFSGVVSRLLGVFSLGAVYGFKNPVRKGAAA